MSHVARCAGEPSYTRRFLLGAAAVLLGGSVASAAMSPDDPIARVGGYFLTQYGGPDGPLASTNLISAMGSVSGLFAQLKARALLQSGVWKQDDNSFTRATTADGQTFFFGDAPNVALYGAVSQRLEDHYGHGPEGLGLWNYVAAAARDPKIGSEVDIGEIAQHTAESLGSSAFGVPRAPAGFQPSEPPLTALGRHARPLWDEFKRLEVSPDDYTRVFGLATQNMIPWTAGERGVAASPKMPAAIAVRLFMEAAIPMAKVDPHIVGVPPL